MKLIQALKKYFDLLILFVICVGIFTFLLKYVTTDIPQHLLQIEKINNKETFYPANFAFYFVVNALSGFSSLWKLKVLITIVLLSLASVLKYAISKKIIIELNANLIKRYSTGGLTLIALSLFLCFAIPDPFSIFVLGKFYLGRFVPIVWHNSTTVFLFPFAILLFWKQLKVFHLSYNSNIRDIFILNMLVVTNAIIKPSFLFVYLPVTFLFLLNKSRSFSGRDFLLNLTPLFTGTLIILIQTLLIYKIEMGSFQESDSSISFGYPFKMLTAWIPMWYIPISFILSFLLPIFASIIYKEILTHKPYLFALCLTVTGIVISTFVYEEGPRMYHGNFMWQNIICSYLLFLSTVSFLTPKILDKNSWKLKEKIIMGLFALHTFSGILYLVKIGLTLSYI